MAKSSFDAFRDLDITRDEIDRIGEALKDEQFRKLLGDYVQEVNDPENRRIFEEELTQLERERGVDVTFINPAPGYVLKTSLDGNKKAFVNVCSSERVGQPTSRPSLENGVRGLQWSLPHSLAPPREDMDNKKARCQVFDVVFHPDTLHLAQKNPAFKTMVNRTACDAVEANFDCKLDQKNLKFPNLKFKGIPRPTIIRKQVDGFSKPEEGTDVLEKIYDGMPSKESAVPKIGKTKSKKEMQKETGSKYTTPKYEIKHRSHVEMETFTYERCAKMHSAMPKELIVEIDLPMLKAATDIDLDVTDKTVQLKSEKPARYKLSITLPYRVYEASGSAKFDKDTKKLIVTLPVRRDTKPLTDFTREDSGVESDHGSISPPREKIPDSPPPAESVAFLDSRIEYNLPEYTCHLTENLIFTLAVKNVSEDSVERVFDGSTLQVKFISISSGHFPAHYAFCVQLPEHEIDSATSTIETWDNNVVVQLAVVHSCDTKPTRFFIGTDKDHLIEKHVDQQCIEHDEDDEEEIEEDVDELREFIDDQPKEEEIRKPQVQKANKILDTVELKLEPKKQASRAIDISASESSGDELSCGSCSPKYKGILKRMSSTSSRSSVSRSISESSVDDFTWASSFENCYSASQDDIIREEDDCVEQSTSLKKTVRFNNNVLRQLFRSNSSILGQKKKNQRKNRNKKRAQERRHSESEVSESEKEKERDFKTAAAQFKKTSSNKSSKDDIFAIDM